MRMRLHAPTMTTPTRCGRAGALLIGALSMGALATTIMAGGCAKTGLLDAGVNASDAAEPDVLSTPDTAVAPDIGEPDDVPTELVDTGPPCSAPPESVRDLRASDAIEARFVVLDWAPDDNHCATGNR